MLVLGIVAFCISAQEAPQQFVITPDVRTSLDQISADSLRGHLSFIASDLLEGRNSPSRGLDIAAEYIAAQFRRAGLEPAGDDGYFQVANWQVEEADADSFDCTFRIEGETYRLSPARSSLSVSRKLDVSGAPLVKIEVKDAKALAALTADQIQGKAVLIELPEAT